MPDLKDLRDSLEKRVVEARAIVEAAKAEVNNAQMWLRKAETDLAQLNVEVERRLAAIQLVEEMVAEADRSTEQHPFASMTQEDAMRAALAKAGQLMNSTELAEALRRGGYPFRSTNPANSVVVAANTNRNGYFTTGKEGNRTVIGLKEWGPDLEAANPLEESDEMFDSSDIGPGAFR